MKKAILIVLVIIGILTLILLSGCLPVEEEILPTPTLSIPEPEIFRTLPVDRGDVVLYRDMRAVLVPAREEILSFPMNGILFDKVHVRIGDFVSVGDILIELDRKAYIDELEQITRDLEMAQLRLKQLREMHNINLQRAEILGYKLDMISYNRQHDNLTGQIEVLKIRKENVKDELERRILRATMDGYVTMVHRFNEWDRSVADLRMVTIADVTETVFLVTGIGVEYLKPGDEVMISIRQESHYGIVIDPEKHNITANRSDNEAYILVHEGYQYGFTTTTSGMTRVIIETAKDVLHLPINTVYQFHDRAYVFIVEDGLRVLRNITTGLKGNTAIEVTGGLEQGELVIIN